MDERTLFKCPWCDVVKNIRGLACHAGKTHKRSNEELHCVVFYNGEAPLCKCGCGQKAKWNQKRYGDYLRGHNGFSKEAREQAVKSRVEACARGEISSWNAGLTKETDERVKLSSEKIKEVMKSIDMSAILNSRTPEQKAITAQKISNTKLGLLPWNTGLTKKDHEGLRVAAEKISKIKQENDPRRFSPQEFLDKISHVTKFELLSNPNEYRNKYTKLVFRCKDCQLEQLKNMTMLVRNPEFCNKCTPKESVGQLEVYSFVKNMFPDATLSDKTIPGVTEVDVHVPSKSFGIEYNGLWWHSEDAGKDIKYHQNKTDSCRKQNIQLLHVYEDEWKYKRSIVESMIRHRLGVTPTRLGARDCQLKILSTLERKTFFDNNHLDGDTQSKISFGLFYQNNLVSAISLRKPFHTKWKEYIEIGRFSNKLNTSVSGAFSKLNSAAYSWAKENGYKGIMSYVDDRLGIGDSYTRTGFNKVSTTAPTFYWTDLERRFNRFKFRADKERNMTERNVAEEAGVIKIYGCKNHVFVREI